MSRILELREKRAKAWDAAKAFLDGKKCEGDYLSAEDTAVYEKMESEVVNLGKEIDRLERQKDIDAELSKLTSTPITNTPQNRIDVKSGRANAEYKSAFWNSMRGKRDVVYNALQTGADTEGGYLVPDEFESTLVEKLEQENVLRGLATVITSSGGDKKISVAATKGTASWVDEEGAISDSDDSFGQVSLGAYKLATMIKVSEELLNDAAFDLESYIAREFARRIGTKEEEAFIAGDSTGKPTGILTTAEIGVTTNSATAITMDDIIELFYSLKVPYRSNAAFITNDATVKALRKLKDGNGQYLWQPSIKEGAPDMILSRPVYSSQYVPAIAAGAKTIAFGDFSYFWIADRQGRTFKRLNELFAVNGQVGFIASQRVDGKLILPEAVKVLRQKAS